MTPCGIGQATSCFRPVSRLLLQTGQSVETKISHEHFYCQHVVCLPCRAVCILQVSIQDMSVHLFINSP